MQNSSISPGLRARIALEKHGFRPTHSLGQNFILGEDFLSGLLDLAPTVCVRLGVAADRDWEGVSLV